jgi:cytoskeletal protein RodZ
MALVGLAAVVVGLAARVTPVSADALQNAEARVTDLSEQAVNVAVLVHQMSVRFEADRAETGYLREQLAISQTAVLSLQLRSSRTESLLRQEALRSYVDEVPAAGSAAPLAMNLIELDARTTYLSLAAGDISDTIDQYRLDQAELSTAIGTREVALRHELAAEKVAGNQRVLALREAGSLQLLLAQAQVQAQELSAPPPTSTPAPSAGLPVGNGVVDAVSQAMGTTPPSSTVLMSDQASGPTTTAPTTTPTSGATLSPTTTRAPPVTTVAAASITTTTEPVTTTAVAPATTTTIEPVTTTTAAPPTTAAPAATTTASSAEPPPAGGVWLELRECESGDNYQTDTGNGFYGAYQFAASTWTGLGLSGLASQAPYWVQDEAAERLQAQYGWKPWPACSAALGL